MTAITNTATVAKPATKTAAVKSMTLVDLAAQMKLNAKVARAKLRRNKIAKNKDGSYTFSGATLTKVRALLKA